LDFSKGIKIKAPFLLIVIFSFYVGILVISDAEALTSNLQKVKLEYYLVIFPLLALRLLIFSFRFHVLLSKTNLSSSLKESLGVYMAGLSMVLIPGGIGSLIKSYILKKKISKSYSSSVPVVVYEKWLDLTSIVIIIGFLLIWATFIESIIVFSVGVTLCVTIIIILKKIRGFNTINRLIQKVSFLKNKSINIDEYKETINVLTKFRTNLSLLLLSIVPRLITVVIVFLIFRSFGLDFDIFSSSQIYYTSTLIGILSFVPGGIIVTEASILGMLLHHDVEFELATLLVIVLRFVNIWFASIIGLVFLRLILRKIIN